MSSKPLSFPIPFEVQAPTCPVITDKSVLDAIGNTPLIRIHNIGKEFNKYRDKDTVWIVPRGLTDNIIFSFIL